MEDPAFWRRRLATASRAQDSVLLRNGDSLDGVLQALDRAKNQVQIQVANKPVTVSLEKVAAIALSSELAVSLRPKSLYGRVVLANGGRLSLLSATSPNGNVLEGQTLFKAAIQVPLTEVRALTLHQGPVTYLSEMKPQRFEQTPFASVTWPLMLDASVTGQDLRLAGHTYDRGLGMHSASRVSYALGGQYRRFETLVGLDERMGQRGQVRLEVQVDGQSQPLGVAEHLSRASGTVALNIAVAGAKELTLIVDFGRGGDVGDHVNWADARLVR
jgi:hypothetical protein